MDQASIGDLLDYLEAQGDALETFGWESRFEQYLDADEGILEHEEFSAYFFDKLFIEEEV
jgi:hypothetical protein